MYQHLGRCLGRDLGVERCFGLVLLFPNQSASIFYLELSGKLSRSQQALHSSG